MLKKDEIIRKIEANKKKIKKYGVKKLGLFGSFLKGKQTTKSDIDVLIEIDKNKISESYFELLFYFEDLFKRKIDLIIASDLRPELNYVKKEAEYVKL